MRYSSDARTSSLLRLAVTAGAIVHTTCSTTSQAKVLVADVAEDILLIDSSPPSHPHLHVLSTSTVSKQAGHEEMNGEDNEEKADPGILLSHHHHRLSPGRMAISSASSSFHKEDTAIVLPAAAETATATAACATGYLVCVNGFAVDDATGLVTGTTCGDACSKGPVCCSGDRACSLFTGKVCQDGGCNGKMACYKARITSVVNSCTGQFSCMSAGYGPTGVVGTLVNSCQGYLSCNSFGFNGIAGNVQDSCNAVKGCWQVAFSVGASVGNISSSCNAYKGCYKAAKFSAESISSNMNNCCNADNECISATKISIPAQCTVRSREENKRMLILTSCLFVDVLLLLQLNDFFIFFTFRVLILSFNKGHEFT